MSLRVIQYADLENTYDDPEQIARFAGTIDSLRDENTILVGCGDNIAPGGLSLLTGGQQALEFFSTIEPDIDTLGNHDFDYGTDTLLSVIRESPQCWVCANAYVDKGECFGQSAGIVPWTIIERAGHRLGVFGLAHPKTDSKSPGAESLSFTDPIAAAADTVERLRERNVDHVLCVSHLGEEEGHGLGEVDDLAQVDIDVICDGHTHGLPRIERVAGTLLVRTSGEGVDINELRFDGEWTATRHQITDTSRDQAVERLFRELRASAGLDEVVATVEEPITRSRETRYHGESRLGNFVTDAYRWVTDTGIALQHSAGMREGPDLYGDVTVADLVSVVPFDMEVVQADVSGEVLIDMLAFGGEIVIPSKPEFWHIHLSGGSVAFDYAERNVEEVTVDGQPIDPSAYYTVAGPENYLHSFGVSSTESFGRQYEVLTEYARAKGITPELDGRITLRGRSRLQENQ